MTSFRGNEVDSEEYFHPPRQSCNHEDICEVKNLSNFNDNVSCLNSIAEVACVQRRTPLLLRLVLTVAKKKTRLDLLTVYCVVLKNARTF